MSVCEQCWRVAFVRAIGSTRSQTEHYLELLEENADIPGHVLPHPDAEVPRSETPETV